MSTRAIIGIKAENGTILGAWQWNDGAGLVPTLNKHFNTEEKARKLIEVGIWSSMFTEKEKDEYENWLLNDLYKGRPEVAPDRNYVEVCGMYLLQNAHHRKWETQTYADFDDAMGQDINYLYLFDKKTGKWKVYH